MGTDALIETTNNCDISPLGFIFIGFVGVILVLYFFGVFSEPADGLPSHSDRKY